ncbi:NAD(P)-dependent malic enzyme [Lysinibacter cavernae]|uniref:Malate dehydrogenase (Oxaloacetate-decarboxylating) n=1 Tax=Lysinibacter cavernae TaxID=1640652 RepID=A0A7X5R114_9MICO|nr:NADP-dependent malic enzyme [Lysinibacter cavernae]NIH53621.1 malate dehydrogenase (oxaloacetate-decarboxylating) [Lysinibacter cavernae]
MTNATTLTTTLNPAAPTTEPISNGEIFAAHSGGKLTVTSRIPLDSKRNLSIAYTPGVAKVSQAIADTPEDTREYTWAERLVVVVSNGTAVLGLGDIGARASLPVMEGKSALFTEFSGLNSIPLVTESKSIDEIVKMLVMLRPSFGAVNLEDFAAPDCFELERRLIEELDCPVMHDDQHGTAVVSLAALKNATRITGRKLEDNRIVILGVGAAGVAIAKILLNCGVKDVVLVDSRGIVSTDRTDLTPEKQALSTRTNPRGLTGGIDEALTGAHAVIGVSSTTISEASLALMEEGPIVFGLSNPNPEVSPELAARYAAVYATGRSDYPNQINNVLAFPGIFRGALDSGATKITEDMKLAAAQAIADLVGDDVRADYIVPSPLDPRVAEAVAAAVEKSQRDNG